MDYFKINEQYYTYLFGLFPELFAIVVVSATAAAEDRRRRPKTVIRCRNRIRR